MNVHDIRLLLSFWFVVYWYLNTNYFTWIYIIVWNLDIRFHFHLYYLFVSLFFFLTKQTDEIMPFVSATSTQTTIGMYSTSQTAWVTWKKKTAASELDATVALLSLPCLPKVALKNFHTQAVMHEKVSREEKSTRKVNKIGGNIHV